MSIAVDDIVAGTYQLLNRPSQADLPYEDVLENVRDAIRGRIVDLKLAQRNHTLSIGSWVTPSAREMSTSGFVGGLEQFIPTKVEWRYLAEATLDPLPQPRKVTVVSYEAIGDMESISDGYSETYCAFYTSFGNIAFSENTTELALRQYRILYEDMELTSYSKAGTIDLPALFTTLAKYEAALLCLDKVRNPEFSEERERLRAIFTQQFMIWNDRFSKWRTTSWGNKKVKTLGYRRTY